MIGTIEVNKKSQLNMEYLDMKLSFRDTPIGVSYVGKLKKNDGEIFDVLNSKLYEACKLLEGSIYIKTSSEPLKVLVMDTKQIMNMMCDVIGSLGGGVFELDRKKDSDKLDEYKAKNKELLSKIGIEEKKLDEAGFLENIKSITESVVKGEIDKLRENIKEDIKSIEPQVTNTKQKQKGKGGVVAKTASPKIVPSTDFFSDLGI